jgi:Cu(I)/Ag(I) efflux system membrane fusion protein
MSPIMNDTSSSRRAAWTIAGTAALLVAAGAGYGISQWRMSSQSTSRITPVVAAGAPAERKVLYWYDPMSPQQHFDKPGKSPFMDMMLVPRYADDAASAATGSVRIDPRVAQSLGMRTVEVKRETLSVPLTVLATVGFNERDVAIVQSRTAGFVERVRPLAPGDVVAAGTTIAEVLVPEWAGAQQEFLALRASGDAALTAASRQRLRLLGMPDALIADVERSGRVRATQSISAPIAGVVQELDVRNGMSLAAGATLARINGIATMWMEAALPESQASMLAPGRAVEARLAAYPGEVFHGSVNAVLSDINRDTRTLRVRMSFPNPRQRLKAGMTAQVSLPAGGVPELVVPSEAVVRTGQRTLVFVVEADGRYRPVAVELGRELGDKLVVRQGLSEGQRIVSSGQFLVDSEASLAGVLPAGTAASGAR